MNRKNFQLTLAILKPDVCSQPPLRKEVIEIMLQHRFLFIRSKWIQMSLQRAEQFYQEHAGRFFFRRLTQFMASGPMSVHILGRYNAITEWRTILGPTKVIKAQFESPDSIRGRYGVTDTRNVAHGSDSPEKAVQEIQFFFPDFDCNSWLQRNCPDPEKGTSVPFDWEREEHRGLK